MRYTILTKIKADDNLAKLLNAYMRPLSTLEQFVLPHESMAEYGQLLQSATSPTPSEEADHLFNHSTPRFYYLQVLDNALTDLHKNIHWALKALTKFFAEYEGDVRRYAIENRLNVIDEYGSDDSSDWEEDGFDEEGQKWKVTYKDDAPSLAPYSLHNDLAQYFKGADSRGEKIGTSTAADYTYFSAQVAHATDLSVFKFLRETSGKAIPLYRENEQGDMVEQTLGEEVENELNEDLHNQSIVQYFHLVLNEAQKTAAHYHACQTSEDFRQLLTQLEQLRDVCFF